ncbi:[4Fe-4S] proteins maturation [Hypoxylon texense]
MLSQILSVAALAATVSAHGLITSPTPRAPGDASIAACGSSVVANIANDKTSHVEGLPELAAKDAGYKAELCNLWLCKGLQYADNAANVQKYAPGQSVNIQVSLSIPHVGAANVSIVDTKTDTIIGAPLLNWPSGYADERAFYGHTTPVNQTNFNVTIPEDLGTQCSEAGACVIQWWWYGTGAKQTYESCIDFTA